MPLHDVLEVVEEPRPVLLVDEAIVEDPQRLVEPQPDHLVARRARVLEDGPPAQQHALHDAADVAEVEGVVGLGGRGQERQRDLGVDVERGRDALRLGGPQLLGQPLPGHVPVEDRREDVLERGPIELGDHHRVEVPRVPGRDVRAAATGRAHRAHKLHVLDRAEGVLPVVPPAVVHPLAQELDGWLRPELLLVGHVEVVDEDDGPLVARGPVDAKSLGRAAVEAPVDHVLRDVGRGAGGEVDEDRRGELVRGQRAQELLHVHGFARARLADHQHGRALPGVQAHQEGVAHRVGGRYDDLAELGVGRDGRRVHDVRPAPPGPRVPVEEIVEDRRAALLRNHRHRQRGRGRGDVVRRPVPLPRGAGVLGQAPGDREAQETVELDPRVVGGARAS